MMQANQLPQYVQEMFPSLAPTLPAMELTLNSVHTVPKPSFLAGDVPRDVLLSLHFYRTKEILLDAPEPIHLPIAAP